MSTRYIIDEKGERVASILDIVEYERIMDDLEELENIRDARSVRAAIERGVENVLPWEQARKEVEAERDRLGSRGEL